MEEKKLTKKDMFLLVKDVLEESDVEDKEDLIAFVDNQVAMIEKKAEKAKEKRLHRSEADKKIIESAKALLMERHHMTEPEAHKYLQKCAMDSGTSLLETAEMVISISHI